MTIVYPVIFTKTNDKKDTYLVEIPDLKGFTEGRGLADAVSMARDYIGGWCMEKEDVDIPKATDPTTIDVGSSEFADGANTFIALVDLDLDVYRRKMMTRAVRKNVSIPEWMDRAAKQEHINVSRVLQEALIQKIGAR